jgi:protein O-mannosyl-transferase
MNKRKSENEIEMTRQNTTQMPARNTISQSTASAGCKPTRVRIWTPIGICIGLVLAVVAVYWQTSSFQFLHFDDDATVFDNDQIRQGLTPYNVDWAFTQYHAGYWQPATAISHMVDVELYRDPSAPFGQWAGGHHRTNMLIHACNAILCFLALRRLTGNLWPSAFAAAVFALHPLRVESVAWITERKDMLSGFFFFLALLAYASYARRPSLIPYLLVVVAFILGMVSKPMVVTLPFVLLLLDFWPLGCMRRTAGAPTLTRLLLEKAPLLALAMALSLVTYSAQDVAVKSIDEFSLTARIFNTPVSYAIYIRQTLWPAGLSPFYPHRKDNLPAWQIIGATALVLAISVAVIRARCTRPYLLIGWLWYLGMLVPVIGLMQSGYQAHADRFTYLPQIGLIMGLTWWAADLAFSWKLKPSRLAVAAGAIIVVLTACSWEQTAVWRDSVTVFGTAVERTTENGFCEYHLGVNLGREGKRLEAIEHLRKAADIEPNEYAYHYDFGVMLWSLGRYEEAVRQLRRSLEISPTNYDAANNLGCLLNDWFAESSRGSKKLSETQQSRILDQAWNAFDRARELDPESDRVYFNLGQIRAEQGRLEEAIPLFRKSIELCTDRIGDSLERVPALGRVFASLGTAYYDTGKMPEALVALGKALRLQPDNWECLSVLAAVYAESGRFSDAVTAGEHALSLAAAEEPDAETIKKLQDQLAAYRDRRVIKKAPAVKKDK